MGLYKIIYYVEKKFRILGNMSQARYSKIGFVLSPRLGTEIPLLPLIKKMEV